MGMGDSIFYGLGQELGIRNIVDSMLEQVRLNGVNIFRNWNDQFDDN